MTWRAKMIAEGSRCSQCGCYLTKGKGKPRKCVDCRGGETGSHRRYRNRANKGTARRKGV